MPKPAYFIFDARIHDRDAMQPYMQGVESTYHAFGGQLLVLGGQLEVVEGDEPLGNLVILQFPDREAAGGWYASDEYQALLPFRLAGSRSNAWLVSGIGPTTAPR